MLTTSLAMLFFASAAYFPCTDKHMADYVIGWASQQVPFNVWSHSA